MIAPLMPFSLAGNLWYQCESNVVNAEVYDLMLKELTNTWRDGFQCNFPFYYAQIAPYKGYEKEAGVKVREMQRRFSSSRNTEMIVISDIGDTTDIHPRNKIDARNRFAKAVLHSVYNKTEFPMSGPRYRSHTRKGKKVTIHFDYSNGLRNDGDALHTFELQDQKGTWHKAKARIKGDTVVVSSKEVDEPMHVRFAWDNSVTPRLMNANNLPTSCFNTNPDVE